MNEKRVRKLNKKEGEGPVAYWMSRDQRVNDNWALLFAQELANKSKQPLIVVFCLVKEFLGATVRQYGFMLKGLELVEQDLRKKNIPFYMLTGDPAKKIPAFIKKLKIGVLVTDFDPLKIKQKWKEVAAKEINVPFFEVDAHNIVPCWIASQKQEWAAYTLRPKIKKLLPEYLEKFSSVKRQTKKWKEMPKTDWKKLRKTLQLDFNVPEVDWVEPGEKEGLKMLRHFERNKLKRYSKDRNDPSKDALSGLSPYFHFGQLSSQRAALEIKGTEAFLEEVIVRKELSDNFCFYNRNYDSVKGFPDWTKKTLDEHKKDKRKYVYSLSRLEKAQTHDDLWNAAQMEMVRNGKMHGYMRMYWGKKVLEWTKSPKQALKYAVYLNDKYELDGRDPNGYTGIAWSIGGVHDRAWPERKIFGKIRFMSYAGSKSKFSIEDYISKVRKL
ncbi:MAG: deoxyribodipyrimidine photo-lyase [Acidobacteriota bacterium]